MAKHAGTSGILIKNGAVVLPRALLKDTEIFIRSGKIVSITPRGVKNTPRGVTVIDAGGAYVSPGFIDTHIHGAPDKISKNEIKTGTTSVIIAESCAPLNKLAHKIRKINRFVKESLPGCNILGVRVEGPYISREKAGAQDSRYIRVPDEKEAGLFIKSCGPLLKAMTIAPEITGANAIIKLLKKNKVIVSLGHSNATRKETELGIKAGASHSTHMFNAMSGPDKKSPGLSDAILANPQVWAEVILDMIHVHKALFKLLIEKKGVAKTILTTDSIRAESRTGVREISGIYRLEDGTIAGSALTMIEAVKNAVQACGLRLTDAIKMATENPAKLLGLESKKGAIAAGMDADIVIFDEDFNVKATIIGGEIVYVRNSRIYRK